MKRLLNRLLAYACAAALAFAPALAFAAPPSSDGVSSTVGITGTASITTTSSSGVLEVPICTETTNGTSPTVTSVNASGLTFTRRSTTTNSSGSFQQTLEVWQAPYSSTQTAKAVTVTMSAGVDDGLFGVAAFTGLNSNAAPFDTNGSLPATATNNTGGSAPTAPVFSTTQANDVILAASCSASGTFDTASGYTTALSGQGPGPNILFAWMSLIYKTVTSTQASATVPYNAPSNTINVRYVDAMTADASGGGSTSHAQSLSLLGVQ